jgi:hypothetical protein
MKLRKFDVVLQLEFCFKPSFLRVWRLANQKLIHLSTAVKQEILKYYCLSGLYKKRFEQVKCFDKIRSTV